MWADRAVLDREETVGQAVTVDQEAVDRVMVALAMEGPEEVADPATGARVRNTEFAARFKSVFTSREMFARRKST